MRQTPDRSANATRDAIHGQPTIESAKSERVPAGGADDVIHCVEIVNALLSMDDINVFRNGSLEDKKGRLKLLFNSLERRNKATLLSGFCQNQRESYDDNPWVGHVDVAGDLSGSIAVDSTGSVYNGCPDMDKQYEYEESVHFTISIENTSIQFTSDPPQRPERSMDDEL